jgi:hypothetical protein
LYASSKSKQIDQNITLSHIFATIQIIMPTLSDTTCDAGNMSTRCVTSMKKSTRRVTFENKADVVRNIPSIDELPEEDIDSLWYSENEYLLIHKSCVFIVKMMESKRIMQADDDELCTRGLEFKTKAAAKSRRRQVEISIDSVLLEQERQWDEQYDDPKNIAEVYRQATAQSSIAAHLSGQKDAKIVLHQARAGHIICCTTPKASPVKRRDLGLSESLRRQSSLRSFSPDSDSSRPPSTRRL